MGDLSRYGSAMVLRRRHSLRCAPVLVAATLAVLGGCQSSAPDKRTLQYLNTQGFGNKYTGNAEEENYLTIGDRVQFADAYNPELMGVETVDIDGTIVLPELGAVPVAGLTRTQVEALLTQRFSPYFKRNDIKVTLATSPGKIFYLVGEVNGPGQRPFTGDLTIFDVIMQSPVKEHSSNLGRVQLIRADPRDPLIITCNIAEMLRTGDSTFNLQIKERDIIVVPPTMLAQVGYFISDLIFPFTTVFKTIIQSFALFSNLGNLGGSGGFGLGGFGGNKFGNNKNFNVF